MLSNRIPAAYHPPTNDIINQTNYLHLKGNILYIIHFIIYTVYYLLFLTPWHDMIIRKGKSWWKVSILCTVRLNIIILRDGFSNWGFTFQVLSFWLLGRLHKKSETIITRLHWLWIYLHLPSSDVIDKLRMWTGQHTRDISHFFCKTYFLFSRQWNREH